MNTDQVVREWLIEEGQENVMFVIEKLDADSRDDVSELAMSLSLCPVHFIDWAICFDDQDPNCDQIRACFPMGHDT